MMTLPKITKPLLALCFTLIFGSFLSRANASHVAGGEMRFSCAGGCTTQVDLVLYRDCNGVPSFNSNLLWTALNSCGSPTMISSSGPAIVDVTPICPSFQNTCQNPSAPINGFEEFTYTQLYDVCGLDSCEYNVSFTHCCRPAYQSSGSASQTFYLGTSTQYMVDSTACNNSPVFGNSPAFYVCQGGVNTHDMNITDADGDSLVITMASCSMGTGSVTYAAGFSPTSPLGPSWQVGLSGDTLTFTPNPGNIVTGVICIHVDEYRNGFLIGRVERDFMVTTMVCPGAAPVDITSLDNPQNASTSGFNVLAMAGDSICFDILTNSLGGNADLYTSGLPSGAQLYTVSNNPTDTVSGANPTGRVCWATPGTAGTWSFYSIIEASCGMSMSIDSQLVTITTIDSTDLVWPGDANDDGTADVVDLLSIGVSYGNTGPARPNASNSWVGQMAYDWGDTTMGGVDEKFADCNGDSTVNANDTLPLVLNYGLSHNKGFVFNKGNAADPALWLEFPTDSAQVGDTVYASVFLGDNTNPANDIYGVAMSLFYDNSLTDSGNVFVDFSNSWIGSSSQTLSLYKDFYANGQIDLGIVRTDQQSVSGMGEVATIGLILTDNIDGKTLLTETLNMAMMNVWVIDETGGKKGLSSVTNDSLIVWQLITSNTPDLSSELEVYPNPATSNLSVRSGWTIDKIEIVNVLGQTMRSVGANGVKELQLPVNELKEGIYFLRVHTNGGLAVKRIVIRRN